MRLEIPAQIINHLACSTRGPVGFTLVSEKSGIAYDYIVRTGAKQRPLVFALDHIHGRPAREIYVGHLDHEALLDASKSWLPSHSKRRQAAEVFFCRLLPARFRDGLPVSGIQYHA